MNRAYDSSPAPALELLGRKKQTTMQTTTHAYSSPCVLPRYRVREIY